RAPVRALRVVVRPDEFAGVHVPRLHFTKMIGAGNSQWTAAADTDKRFARRVLDLRSHVRSADVVVGGNVDHAGLWTECNRRPVLAAVRSRTEVGTLARSGFAFGIHIRTAGLRIQASKDILKNERLAFNELDRTGASFQEPEISVTRCVNQAFVGSPVAL